MPIGTGLISTGILLGANAFLYGGGGIAINKLRRFSSKTYDNLLRPSIERAIGKRPKKIVTSRAENTLDGKLVFKFENVSIFDIEAIKKELNKEFEETPIDLSIRETEFKKTHEKPTNKIIEKPTEPQATSFEYYDVELTIDNPDITIGEIDFSNWNRDDFSIKIINKKTNEPLENDLETETKIIETLSKYAKISINSSLTPDQIAKEKIDIAGNKYWDIVKQIWDPRVRRQSFALEESGPKKHLAETKYLSGLIEVAIKRAEEGDYSIIENYYGVVEHAIKNEQFAAQKTREKLTQEIKLRKWEKTRGKLITAAIAIGVVVVIAALVAITIINPAVGAALIGIVSSVTTAVISFLGSKLLTGLSALGVTTAIFGIFKAKNDYKRAALDDAKKELNEVKILEQKLREDTEKIQKLKLGVNDTLKIINENKSNKIQEFDFKNKNIGDMGLTVIGRCLNKTEHFSTITTLLLNNNNISNSGLKILGIALVNSQAPGQPNLTLNTIDISDNLIDQQGLLEFSEDLSNNFTLTTLIHNTPIDNPSIQSQIDRQLLINQYLQGESLEELTEKISNTFLSGGLEQLKIEAIIKLENNFNFTAFPSKINQKLKPTINNIIEQNILFQKIAASETPSSSEYIQAFKKDPNRCTHFCINLKKSQTSSIQKDLAQNLALLKGLSYDECRQAIQSIFVPRGENTQANIDQFAKIIPKLTSSDFDNELIKAALKNSFGNITKQNPENFTSDLQIRIRQAEFKTTYTNPLALKALNNESRKEKLQWIFEPKEDAQKNIELFSQLIENIPEDQEKYDHVYLLDTLEKAFNKIGEQNHDTFIKRLEQKRTIIAKRDDLTEEVRRVTLEIFDSALFDRSNEIIFKKIQLEKLITEHPSSLEQTLREFLTIYKSIPQDKASEVLLNINFDELTEIIIADADSDYTLLRSANLTHRHLQELLKASFITDEDDIQKQNKAIFIDSILTNEKIAKKFFSDKTLKEYLKLAVPHKGIWGWGYKKTTYEELKKETEKSRVAAIKAYDEETAQLLDKPIQAVLQNELTSKLLQKVDSKELEKFLSENTELRQYKLPTEINLDQKTKKFINSIILRNKMHDAITNKTDQQNQLDSILKIYSEITPKELRQNALDSLLGLEDNSSKFIELIKNDISKRDCISLISLPEQLRIELLINSLNEDPNRLAIATMAAKLINLKPGIDNKYIWNTFDHPWGTHRKRWDFEEYVSELKKLKESESELSEKIGNIIQAGLKTSIISKFECLQRNSDDSSSFEKLKTELSDNYDLIDFDTKTLPSEINKEVKAFVDFICQRNLFIQATKNKDLERFFENYSELSINDCDKILDELDNNEILELINLDLGSDEYLNCEKLISLDLEHRIKILNRCFLINEQTSENAYKKATMIAKLLEIPNLLKTDPEENRIITYLKSDIKKEIFWALTSGGSFFKRRGRPYYTFSETLKRLEKIVTKLPQETPKNHIFIEIALRLVNAIDTSETTIPASKPKEALDERSTEVLGIRLGSTLQQAETLHRKVEELEVKSSSKNETTTSILAKRLGSTLEATDKPPLQKVEEITESNTPKATEEF